jgi:SAM-dependent methyltransferase
MSQLSVLDLACGEGVYAVETALRGAQVTGVDGRKERMNTGKEVAERLGLKNLQFEQADVRRVSIATHGQFDVVYVLGILYHLDAPDVFTTLENVRTMSRDFIVIDTHISLNGRDEVAYEGALYAGTKWREHGDHDPEGLRRTRLMASLDNTFSFWFTKESLIKLLINIGFTSVFECHGPLDPTKANNRITLVALKGKRTMLSTYPWINDKTDGEIRTLLQSSDRSIPMTSLIKSMSLRKLLGIPINGLLHTLGYEIRRL